MRKLLAGIIAGIALYSFSTAAIAQEKIKLRYSWTASMNGPSGVAIQKFAEDLKQKTNGGIELELFPDSQLGQEMEALSGLREGTIDLSLHTASVIASALEPEFQAVALPGIFKSREAFLKTMDGPVGEEMLASLDQKGIKALAWGSFGDESYILKGFEVKKPEDFRGKRIRVVQSKTSVSTMKALGATPVAMSATEIYTGMQQGSIDGVGTSRYYMYYTKLFEVGTSIAAVDQVLPAILIMNKERFESLSPEYQKILKDAAREHMKNLHEEYVKANVDAFDVMKAKGLTINWLDPSEYKAAAKGAYDDFTAEYGSALVNKLVAAQR